MWKRTTLLLGTVAVAGFLLLLLLLDDGVTPDAPVATQRDGETIEMSVTLTPIEEPEPMFESKHDASQDKPTPKEQTTNMHHTSPPPAPAAGIEREPPPMDPSPGTQESDGQFPALVASYSGTGGLRAHLRALRALGARTFVANMAEERLVAEVDPTNWSLSRNFPPLTRMALHRSRLIDDDASVEAVIARAQARFGLEQPAFVLLMPQGVEDRILRGINRAFERIGRSASQFVSVRGSYDQSGGSLSLSVVAAHDHQGNTVPLVGRIPLDP